MKFPLKLSVHLTIHFIGTQKNVVGSSILDGYSEHSDLGVALLDQFENYIDDHPLQSCTTNSTVTDKDRTEVCFRYDVMKEHSYACAPVLNDIPTVETGHHAPEHDMVCDPESERHLTETEPEENEQSENVMVFFVAICHRFIAYSISRQEEEARPSSKSASKLGLTIVLRSTAFWS